MRLECGSCQIRPWRLEDAELLIRRADNPRVAENLRDRFPSPYTPADAEAWLTIVTQSDPYLDFALVIDDEPIGGIGLALGTDIERVSAEVGYVKNNRPKLMKPADRAVRLIGHKPSDGALLDVRFREGRKLARLAARLYGPERTG